MKVTFEYPEGTESFELPETCVEGIRALGEWFSLTPPEALRYLILAGLRWVQPRLDVLRIYEEKGGESDVGGGHSQKA